MIASLAALSTAMASTARYDGDALPPWLLPTEESDEDRELTDRTEYAEEPIAWLLECMS